MPLRHRRYALRLFGSYRCAVLKGLHGGVGLLVFLAGFDRFTQRGKGQFLGFVVIKFTQFANSAWFLPNSCEFCPEKQILANFYWINTFQIGRIHKTC